MRLRLTALLILASLTAARAQAPTPQSPGVAAFARHTALPAGAAVGFFGDSLTWQGGHVDLLQAAITAARPELQVRLHKRALNGGKSTDLLHGAKDLYGSSQEPFAAVLAADRPAAAVIQIGINDVWHGEKGNPPAVYEQTLRDLLAAAASAQVPIVLCTPSCIGERTAGNNRFDAQLDAYAAIVRQLASSTGTTLCDLRAAFQREQGLRNPLQKEDGVLTTDGVHLNAAGNALLADELGKSLAALLPMADALARATLRTAGALPLVPWPDQVQFGDGALTLPKASRIVVTDERLRAITPALPMSRLLGGNEEITDAPPTPGTIVLALDPTLPDGGYRLVVTDRVTIAGRDPIAVANGCATLVQLIEIDHSRASVPRVTIADAPDCSYRSLLVDVARKPHPIAGLEQLVELCSYYKIRYLQLHLTDDQAFTFPSTAFAAAVTKGHSYTREQLRALDDFATAHGVTLVPELDVPGHCGALIAALPELFRAHELHHATIAFAKPEVLAAIDTLVGEMLDVFRATPFFHVGGDEADLEHVAKNPLFQAAFAREGVANEQELYRRFLVQLRDKVHARGKRMLVWEGFGPAGAVAIPKDVVVMPFESAYHLPDQLAASGYPLVNTAWQPLYVVNDRRWPETWIHAWHVRRWEHFVATYPAYRGIEVPATGNVLGAQLCSWEQPAERELPSLRRRLAALAERTWNANTRRPGADFLQRLAFTDARLAQVLRN